MPQLWVLAGANGSGKSTLSDRYIKNKLPVINPDDIARKLDSVNFNASSVVLAAGKIAIQQREDLLQKKESFSFETTLSGNSELRFIDKAKKAGYKINIIYVCLDNPYKNFFRVKNRVEKGGHTVSTKDIMRRYERSLLNLPKALKMADRTYLVDNSSNKAKICFKLEHNRIRQFVKEVPFWAKNIVQSIKKEKGLGL